MSEHTRPATKYECGKVQYWIDNGIVTGDTATRLQTYLDNHMLNNWGFKEAQKMSIEHAKRQKKTVSSEVAPKPRKIEVEYVED